MSERDFQKSKVYAWENKLFQGVHIPFDKIAAFVAKIWAGERLEWPPLVAELHKNNGHAGTGARDQVSFPKEGASELTIIHEVTHAMLATIDGHTDGHGPQFVGLYMRLLDKHLNIPLPLLLYTAERFKLKYDLFAKPWCGK